MDIKLHFFSLWWNGVLIARMTMMTWNYTWNMDLCLWVRLAEIMTKWHIASLTICKLYEIYCTTCGQEEKSFSQNMSPHRISTPHGMKYFFFLFFSLLYCCISIATPAHPTSWSTHPWCLCYIHTLPYKFTCHPLAHLSIFGWPTKSLFLLSVAVFQYPTITLSEWPWPCQFMCPFPFFPFFPHCCICHIFKPLQLTWSFLIC